MQCDLPNDPGRQPLVIDLVNAWPTFSLAQRALVARAMDPALVECVLNRLHLIVTLQRAEQREEDRRG